MSLGQDFPIDLSTGGWSDQQAYDYLASVWSDFVSKGQQLQSEIQLAQTDVSNLSASGQTSLAQLRRNDISTLLTDYEDWTELYTQGLPYASQVGLGMSGYIIAAIAGGVISLATFGAAVYVWNKKVNADLDTIAFNKQQVAQGQPTIPMPSSGSSIFGGLTSLLGNATGLIVVGTIAYFAYKGKHA